MPLPHVHAAGLRAACPMLDAAAQPAAALSSSERAAAMRHGATLAGDMRGAAYQPERDPVLQVGAQRSALDAPHGATTCPSPA